MWHLIVGEVKGSNPERLPLTQQQDLRTSPSESERLMYCTQTAFTDGNLCFQTKQSITHMRASVAAGTSEVLQWKYSVYYENETTSCKPFAISARKPSDARWRLSHLHWVTLPSMKRLSPRTIWTLHVVPLQRSEVTFLGMNTNEPPVWCKSWSLDKNRTQIGVLCPPYFRFFWAAETVDVGVFLVWIFPRVKGLRD